MGKLGMDNMWAWVRVTRCFPNGIVNLAASSPYFVRAAAMYLADLGKEGGAKKQEVAVIPAHNVHPVRR